MQRAVGERLRGLRDKSGRYRRKSALPPFCMLIGELKHLLPNGGNDVLDFLPREPVVISFPLRLSNAIGNHLCFRLVFVVRGSIDRRPSMSSCRSKSPIRSSRVMQDLVPQCLPRLQCILNPLLRLLLAAKRLETLAF